jgi:hypothetical protein
MGMSSVHLWEPTKPYVVTIPWRSGDTVEGWDRTCCWVIEHFGLPGDRFRFRAGHDRMQFEFERSEDAVLFALRWS